MRDARHLFIGILAFLGIFTAVGLATAAPIWSEDFDTSPSGWDYYMTSLNPYVTSDVSGGQLNMYAPYDSYNATQGFLFAVLSDPAVNPPEREDVEASVVTQISGNVHNLYSGLLLRGQDIDLAAGAEMVTGRGYSYNVSGYDSGSQPGAGEAGLYRLDDDGSYDSLTINYLSDAVYANLIDNDIYVKLSATTLEDGNVLLSGEMSFNADFSDPFGQIEYLDDSAERILGPGLTGIIGLNNESDQACSANWDDFALNELPKIAGDANCDGRVDDADATILATNWQSSGATWATGDFNGDTVVDDSDATLLATNWQAGVGAAAAVPEPSVLTLAFAALATLVWRRRK